MERVIVTRTCKDCCEYPVCASRDYYVEHGPVGWVNHAYQHVTSFGVSHIFNPRVRSCSGVLGRCRADAVSERRFAFVEIKKNIV